MQKKLIAAAVAGLIAVPALAQTNVTISGRFAAGWENYSLSSCTAGFGCSSESRVSDQSSRIIFNVVEDLGGGLKAWAQADARFNVDLGGGTQNSANIAANQNQWMGGNTGVGFSGNWGKFTIGRWDVHYSEFGAIEGTRAGSLQANAGIGIMSQVNGTTIANGTRTPNLLMWDSPNWNGFTGRLAYSSAYASTEGSGRDAAATDTGNPGGGYAWTGALRYNNGPWTAGYSHWYGNSENRGKTAAGAFTAARADQRSDRLWLGYTFAMGLKVGLGWDRSRLHTGAAAATTTTSTSRNAWMVPVSYEFGPHKVYGTYARTGSHSGSAVAAGTGGNLKATQWVLGYDYAFSKRTSVGAFYTKVNNNRNAAGTVGGTYDMFGVSAATGGTNGATATSAGEDARQIYIGMAHNF